MALFSTEDSHPLNLEKTSEVFIASLESKTKHLDEYFCQLSVEWWSFVFSFSDKSFIKSTGRTATKSIPKISKKGKNPSTSCYIPASQSTKIFIHACIKPWENGCSTAASQEICCHQLQEHPWIQHISPASGRCPGRCRVWKVFFFCRVSWSLLVS